MPYMVEPTAEQGVIFGAKCPKCGHISYFKKPEVCPAEGEVQREIIHRGDVELDGLHLTCRACGVNMIVPVDCRGYK